MYFKVEELNFSGTKEYRVYIKKWFFPFWLNGFIFTNYFCYSYTSKSLAVEDIKSYMDRISIIKF